MDIYFISLGCKCSTVIIYFVIQIVPASANGSSFSWLLWPSPNLGFIYLILNTFLFFLALQDHLGSFFKWALYILSLFTWDVFLLIWRSTWLVLRFASLQYLFFSTCILAFHVLWSLPDIFPTILNGRGLRYEGGEFNFCFLIKKFCKKRNEEVKLTYSQPLLSLGLRSFSSTDSR